MQKKKRLVSNLSCIDDCCVDISTTGKSTEYPSFLFSLDKRSSVQVAALSSKTCFWIAATSVSSFLQSGKNRRVFLGSLFSCGRGGGAGEGGGGIDQRSKTATCEEVHRHSAHAAKNNPGTTLLLLVQFPWKTV